MDFRERVAEHYRNRGYRVREGVKVRSSSGGVFAVDMVVEGPLGNMVVTFGGLDGLDEGDLAHIKRVAKAVGATAVGATENVEPVVRRTAQREGIVLLDHDLPTEVADDPLATSWPSAMEDVLALNEDHPWPQSGKTVTPGTEALRNVALDDLLHDDDEPVAVVPDAPSEPRPADILWGKKTEAPPPAAKPADKFGWLRRNDVPEQGGYEFEEAEPVRHGTPPRAGPHEDAAASASASTQVYVPRKIADPKLERERVLREVRARVDGVPGARRAVAPEPPTPEDVPDAPSWMLRVGLGGAVAGIVVWLLWRFAL